MGKGLAGRAGHARKQKGNQHVGLPAFPDSQIESHELQGHHAHAQGRFEADGGGKSGGSRGCHEAPPPQPPLILSTGTMTQHRNCQMTGESWSGTLDLL